VQVLVFWEEFQDGLIGAIDVFLVSRKRYPSKWSLAFTEQRSDVCGDEPRELEGV
jgi:hypothetical protein